MKPSRAVDLMSFVVSETFEIALRPRRTARVIEIPKRLPKVISAKVRDRFVASALMMCPLNSPSQFLIKSTSTRYGQYLERELRKRLV